MTKKRKKIIEKPKIIEEKIKKIKIRVIGIGGGAGSIVSEISQKVKGASFFGADTDSKTLKNLARNVEKFQFGQNLTQGFGTGMNPEIGKEAAKNEKQPIKKLLENQDLVILIACLGGGAGSGATPIFAKISKNLGHLTYGIFTFPFKFEGEKKLEIAKNSLRELRGKLNTFSIIPNERIFQIVDRKTPLKKALSSINESLADSLQSLIEIIYRPGLINIDFADLKTVFEGRGYLTYLNSIEIACPPSPSAQADGRREKEGVESPKEAIEKVLHSPLYPYSIEGAKGVLLNISAPKDLSLAQVSQISKTILEKVHKEAKIIFGISQPPKESRMKITILATGCSKKIFLEKPKRLKPKGKIKKTTTHPPLSQAKLGPQKVKQKKKTELPKEESEGVVRKNALQIKKEVEGEEIEMMAKEKFWETPTFLRKKLKTNE